MVSGACTAGNPLRESACGSDVGVCGVVADEGFGGREDERGELTAASFLERADALK